MINGNDEFMAICKNRLVEWYNLHFDRKIRYNDVYIVWVCKTLANYKCLASTNVHGDGIYVEYTYNGYSHELYEDVYHKMENNAYTDEYLEVERTYVGG